jgi:hypothetical protein
LLSETGAVLGSPLIIAKGTAGLGYVGAQLHSTVYNTNTGEFLVVWQDNRNISQGEQDIFAQLVGISNGFDYVLANSGPITVNPGHGGSSTITATLTSGQTQSVSFSVSGLPPGAAASFTNNPCSPTCNTDLNITTTSRTSPGTYSLTVTGGPLGKTTKLDLVVNGFCPVNVAVPNDQSILQTLYRFRDQVMLTSPDRAGYVDLYYAHAAEGAWILVTNPDLRSKVSSMLSKYLPVFMAVNDRQTPSVKSSDVRDIDALIQAFMDKGGPAFRADLERIRRQLRFGTLMAMFGVRVTD